MLGHENKGLGEVLKKRAKLAKDQSPEAERVCAQVAKARGSLVLDLPFIGYIISQLQIYPVKDLSKYAADTHYFYINSSYFDDLIRNNDNWRGIIKGIMVHLVFHLLFKHVQRMQSRNPQVWAYAADIATFQMLQQMHEQWSMPHDWVLPSIDTIPLELRNESAETVYKLLMEQIEEQESNEQSENDPNQVEEGGIVDQKIGDSGKNIPSYGIEEVQCDLSDVLEESNFAFEHLEGIVQYAYARQKEFGTMPRMLERHVKQRYHPSIPWRALLARYLQQFIAHDLSWTRPNRRLFGQGYILPGPWKENVTVLVGLDTSGSISSTQLSRFVHEIKAILDNIHNVRMIIAECDTEIKKIHIVEPGESVIIESLVGGGGTDFRPVFELVKKYTPDLLIYLTDGYGIYPDLEPSIPVIWINFGKEQPPFGVNIRVE